MYFVYSLYCTVFNVSVGHPHAFCIKYRQMFSSTKGLKGFVERVCPLMCVSVSALAVTLQFLCKQ